MMPLVLISALVAVPVILITVLRINAMMVFLSLCLGVVLLRFVGDEAASTIGILTSYGSTNYTLVTIFLQFLPVVLTALFMVRTVRGHLKLMLNFFIAIAVGFLVALLAEPLLGPETRIGIEMTPVWFYIQKLQVLVISLGAIFSLLYLWLQRPKSHEEHHGKHHK
jgi:uncharacterized protein (DUF486 family)